MNFELPRNIQNVMSGLFEKEDIKSIWFIGSRANGTAHEHSDWDFICFLNTHIQVREARAENVDIIQVGKDGKYLLEGQPESSSGDFKQWQWHQQTNETATYKSRIVPKVLSGQTYDLSAVKIITLKAIRIY
ncbi:nucleotidyltransferase domain-containing protein [Planctobacterium marinum]|uniref:nucleotidyltransferase domain-containing protein n=1 Tax=Planctobacterium marinum TaxID=1631968 RepID=UPI001E419ADA|nr:nucleotidyltransferase domain-containing protein [Planctobacterium marinum]MCC2605648.1 nucleotidyltransferase domain-containing protein [Planctobacterium marinum]